MAKHNKKRNIAFLYESIIRELSKCVLEKDEENIKYIKTLLKQYFSPNSILNEELRLYKELYENNDIVNVELAKQVLREAKYLYSQLDESKVWKIKSALINSINKKYKDSFYNHFIPNYKNLATIYQIFNRKTPIKERILLEQMLLESMIAKNEQQTSMKPIDALVYKSFIQRFNESYKDLLKEQKQLLNEFLLCSNENDLSLKSYLNEELKKMYDKLKSFEQLSLFQEDNDLKQKLSQTQKRIEEYKDKEVNKKIILEVLKIQELIAEIEEKENEVNNNS